METKVIELNPDELKSAEALTLLQKAGELVQEGAIVAFPTETVYGLGGDAFDPEAAEKIYEAKGRPSDNPLIVHIADRDALDRIVTYVPEKAELLMDAFWPGPLTLIFHKSPELPKQVTGGLMTVGVRLPSNEVARTFIRCSGGYIAAPSANISGSPSPTSAEHVMEDLNGRVDIVIDAGEATLGLESTIVDLTVEPPAILRPGFITREMIEEVIGPVAANRGVPGDSSVKVPKAPGMKYRHYAPDAELTLFDGEPTQVAEEIRSRAEAAKAKGIQVGVITTDELLSYFADSDLEVMSIGSRLEPESIARNLYRVLREFNETDVEKIYSESFSADGLGEAIMNRLMKAAGHRMVRLEASQDLKDIRRIVIVSTADVSRGPLAGMFLGEHIWRRPLLVETRGLVAPFPEPVNQKIEAIARSHGETLEDHVATQLTRDDIRDDTLFLTIDLMTKIRMLKKHEGIYHIYSLGEFLDESALEIPSPYGADLAAYSECYDLIEETMGRVALKIDLLTGDDAEGGDEL